MNEGLRLETPEKAPAETAAKPEQQSGGFDQMKSLLNKVTEEAIPAEVPDAGSDMPVDSQGTVFDPKIHKAGDDGLPLKGSKKQFLLKPEAKKTNFANKARKFFGMKEKDGNTDISTEKQGDLPLSDHELKEKQAAEQKQNLEIATRHSELSKNSENSADLYFVCLSLGLGVEALNQRETFFKPVAECFYEYERRTGRAVDLPPGVALAMGLGRIGYEIAQREPACKERFDKGVSVLRSNAIKYVGSKIPGFGKTPRKKVVDGGTGGENND